MTEGWSKPNRPIVDRAGHARWRHYFVNKISLCGRWRLFKSDPEPIQRDEIFDTDCTTCRNKLAGSKAKKFDDGWYSVNGMQHYFELGITLCKRFIQNKQPAPDSNPECTYCSIVLRSHSIE